MSIWNLNIEGAIDFNETAKRMVKISEAKCEDNARLTARALSQVAPRGKTGNLQEGFKAEKVGGVWSVKGAPHWHLTDQGTKSRKTVKNAKRGKVKKLNYVEKTINKLRSQYLNIDI